MSGMVLCGVVWALVGSELSVRVSGGKHMRAKAVDGCVEEREKPSVRW